MGEDVHDVSGAVEDVGDDGEQEEAEAEVNRDGGFGRRISDGEVDDDDGGEREVVEQTPRLPEFDAVSGKVAKVGAVHKAEYKVAPGFWGVTLVAPDGRGIVDEAS